MGFLDDALGQLGGLDIPALAAKVGLNPDQVADALAALGVAHAQPGDTATQAANQTGLPVDKLQAILAHLGGEGALGNLAGMVPGGLGGLGSLFGKK